MNSNVLRAAARHRNGFTIVEVIVVIVIIGILATVGIIGYRSIQSSARDKAVLSDLESLDAVQTQYGTQYNVPGKAWYSGSGNDSALAFSPTTGNVIDVGINGTDYCIRIYNPSAANYKTLATAATKESSPGACTLIVASNAAQGLLNCPSGFITVPGSATFGTTDFCVMKYDAKQASATVPISQAAGTPWVSISQITSLAYSPNVAGCTGCHLITDAEWVTIAQNIMSVGSNWTGGSVGSGSLYIGHNDGTPNNALAASSDDTNGYFGVVETTGDQRRTLTLTNGQVIWDMSGNVNNWSQGTLGPGQTPGIPGYSGANWRDYNDAAMNYNALSTINLPVTAYGPASGWNTATQGLGKIYGDYEAVSTWAFQRGCYYAANTVGGIHCGIYTLYLGNTPTYSSIGQGFRVAAPGQ